MKYIILTVFFVLLTTPPVFSNPTSITDDKEYRLFSLQAAHNEALFDTFKRSPVIIRMYQHVTKKLGNQYLQYVISHYPFLIPFFEKFRENDHLGNPIVNDFGTFGFFSPTNLRYIKILGDIQHRFGDLNGKRIIEIGCGYGGQCKILSNLYNFKEYILVDLPEVLELAKTHLEKLSVPNVTFLTPEKVASHDHYDLVISNYAFSECRRDVQKEYLNKVLTFADKGYLICNQLYDRLNEPPLSPEELELMLNQKELFPEITQEIPITDSNNFLMVWGDTLETLFFPKHASQIK